ncbi:MAG: chemotaxis protein CheW [Oceanicaulis sp.]|nr:chemotaxis protein CheW [Oceanicaulis sp.]
MAVQDTIEYVTVHVGGQLFGVEVSEIREVFSPHGITPVPRAPAEIAGLLNLRGRIVTAVETRVRLGLPPRGEDEPVMALGLEEGSELFGVLVDEVGEVLRLDPAAAEPAPGHLDAQWRAMIKGVYRLEEQLLAILDVRALIRWRAALAA